MKRQMFVFLPLIAAASVAGCDFFSSGPDPVSPPDAGIDARVSEAGNGDSAVPDDGEALLDAAADDGATADAMRGDAGSDAGVDAGPPVPGCRDGTEDQVYPSGDMVGCDGALNQCMAGMLCASGWHLCTATEYQARVDLPAFGLQRWIASCIRHGCSSDATSPTDDICGDCTSGEAMTSVAASYDCGTGAPKTMIDCDIGVVADTAPAGNHLVSRTGACTLAQVFQVRELFGAMCCR